MDQIQIYILLATISVLTINISIVLLLLKKNAQKNSLQLEQFVAKISAESGTNRDELAKSFQYLRSDLHQHFGNILKNLNDSMGLAQSNQKDQLKHFSERIDKQTQSTEHKLDHIRNVVEHRLKDIQADNAEKLEKMRHTVDEKLHKTLEDRLSQSFLTVSQRLEKVQHGLGTMQHLAQGVGDLKKVLSNVKTKGVLGEMQLEAILSQIMAPHQYEKNVITKKNSRNFVEFAIKLPGKEQDEQIWVPIDSKFPTENYHRLMEASEQNDEEAAISIRKQLYQNIRTFAKDIHNKYIDPPHTTDFAIMFLPTEGLYAEILRDSQLFESLQREFKVTIAGPSTLSAFIYSLQVGFRSIAIEKHTSEVWKILGTVKTEFEKFSLILEKTKRKLNEANNVIESAETRTRVMKRALTKVESHSSQHQAPALESLETPH